MDTTFSAADIVGKTLVAAKKISVYRDAGNSAQPYGSVAGGQSVGVVYSWLDPSPGFDRSGLWWVFKDIAGNYYYTPHASGNFDVSALKQQGVITVTEKQTAEELDGLPWYERMIRKYGIYLVAIPVVGYVAPPLINNLFKLKR